MITGTLTGVLAAGIAVEIVLPNGQVRQAALGADGVSFSLTVSANADLYDFAVANTVSAYVAGNPAAAVTQAFTAVSQRSFQPVTATPADPAASALSTIALSRDASTVAFVSLGAFVNGRQSASLSVQQLATGVTTLVSDQADIDFGTGVAGPNLSSDGRLLAYAADDTTGNGQEFWLKDLQTGVTTALGSTYLGGSPSLADDGTVVFQGQEAGATEQQIYAARVTAGSVSLLASGTLLGLGSAAVGAGGAWSIDLADTSLAHLGSGDDALVASVGDDLRARAGGVGRDGWRTRPRQRNRFGSGYARLGDVRPCRQVRGRASRPRQLTVHLYLQ